MFRPKILSAEICLPLENNSSEKHCTWISRASLNLMCKFSAEKIPSNIFMAEKIPINIFSAIKLPLGILETRLSRKCYSSSWFYPEELWIWQHIVFFFFERVHVIDHESLWHYIDSRNHVYYDGPPWYSAWEVSNL